MNKYDKIRASIDGSARFSCTRVLSDSDLDALTLQDIREVDEKSRRIKPIGPITGTIYCIDFSDTFYKRMQKHRYLKVYDRNLTILWPKLAYPKGNNTEY